MWAAEALCQHSSHWKDRSSRDHQEAVQEAVGHSSPMGAFVPKIRRVALTLKFLKFPGLVP